MELFSSEKITEEEISKLIQFVCIATVYDHINPDSVKRTISIRKQFKIKLPDAIIAATSMYYNITLITRNIDDFKRINNLQTLNPWSYIL